MKINRTAQRTVEILELVATSERDLTLNEIARMLEIPKTSAFDILETLVHMNMLYIKEHRLKTYAIGVKAYVIGNNYSKTSMLLKSSASIVKELAQKHGLSVLVAKENSGEVIYTLKQEPLQKIIATPEVGKSAPLHVTASGKAILAHAQDQMRIVEELDLNPLTKRTITSDRALKAELFDIRNQGYAISDREFADHIYSIAAPIFDHNGVVSAAVEAFVLYQEDYHPAKAIEAVMEAAKQISFLLGYEGK